MKNGFLHDTLKRYIQRKHNKINDLNKERLINDDVTIIASNCWGGYLYHWLGLKFQSPFINLAFSNSDFIQVLKHFDEFIDFPIKECLDSNRKYPVGISCYGIKILFMHSKSFEEAIDDWNRRKNRINKDNMVVFFSNFYWDEKILDDFIQLPYEHKIVFTDRKVNYDCAFYIKRWVHKKPAGRKTKVINVWDTMNYLTGKRYVDQFDYVSFLNQAKPTK